MLGTTSKKAMKDLFNDIGVKIQFPSEFETNIIPFEFSGVVKDYNGVNIIQTLDYIEMSSQSYIILKSQGWDTLTPKQLTSKNILSSNIVLNVSTTAAAALVHKIQVNREDGLPVQPVHDNNNDDDISFINQNPPKGDTIY